MMVQAATTSPRHAGTGSPHSQPQVNAGPRGFRLRQMNPAFASAHGIATESTRTDDVDVIAHASPKATPSPTRGRRDNTNLQGDHLRVETTRSAKPSRKSSETAKHVPEKVVEASPHHDKTPSTNRRKSTGTCTSVPTECPVSQIIAKARTTGKLQAADVGLSTPLPLSLFAFPPLKADLDMSNEHAVKSWEMQIPETLVIVDFSDNSGITEFPMLKKRPDQSNEENRQINRDSTLSSTQQEGKSQEEWSVERYRSVQIFRARRCQLFSFPIAPTLADSWKQLTTLDLSSNKIQGDFPLARLPKSLRELDVSHNQLVSFKCAEDAAVHLPNLVTLDISHNAANLAGIPAILHVPCLQRIHCGNNELFHLTFLLRAIASSQKSLLSLHAPKCLISDLDGAQPIDFTDFVALRTVDLQDNSLSCIPRIPYSLQRLNVNCNQIKGIEGMLMEGNNDSSALVVVQAQRNHMKSLDAGVVAKLTHLERLDVQYNSLEKLPTELGFLPQLIHVYLDGNNQSALRSSGIRGDFHNTKDILAHLRQKGRGKQRTGESCEDDDPESDAINVEVGDMLSSCLVGTKILNFQNKYPKMLPFRLLKELKSTSEEIVNRVERFKVAKNQLQHIDPDWFVTLKYLKVVEAHDNRLTDLPASIQHLPLAELYLARNRLTADSIQSSLLSTNFPHNDRISETLQVLDLSSNCLERVPSGLLHHLKSLRTLDLSRNKIISLDNLVDKQKNSTLPSSLESLNLGENSISDIGGDDFPLMLAAGCPNLSALLLQNNELRTIPTTLGLIETLKTLDLRGNPQRVIRYDVLEKGTDSILFYLRNRMTAKTKEKATLTMKKLLAVSSLAEEASLDTSYHDDEYSATQPLILSPKTQNATPRKKPDPSPTAASPSPRPKQTPGMLHSTHSTKSNRQSSPGKFTPHKIPEPSSSLQEIGSSSNNNCNSKNNSEKKVSLLDSLQQKIDDLQDELDKPGISEAKRYAVKKKLNMERSKKLREERRLKSDNERLERLRRDRQLLFG